MPAAESKQSESVRVAVRIRPLKADELVKGYKSVVDVSPDDAEVVVGAVERHEDNRVFTFDHVFSSGCAQTDIFHAVVTPILDAVLDGFNGTVFAYGQTGSGKTYTMQGPDDGSNPGVIPLSFQYLFDAIGSTENVQFAVSASYLEVYLDQVWDLLPGGSSRPLTVLMGGSDGPVVKNLQSVPVTSIHDMAKLMDVGASARHTAATEMNDRSSRSHAVFTVTIEALDVDEGGNPCGSVRRGKLHLVDLAGSERADKTMITSAAGMREASQINSSLSALGNVVAALTNPRVSHVPYRDSPLTRLLSDSLGGNAKTVMIANCGPAGYNRHETICTLRWACDIKRIRNKPKKNRNAKDALLQKYKEELEALKAQLAAQGEGAGAGQGAMSVERHAAAAVDAAEVKRLKAAAEATREKLQRKVLSAQVEQARLKAMSEEQRRQLEEQAAREREEAKEQVARYAAQAAKLEERLRAEAEERQQQSRLKAQVEEQVAQLKAKLVQGGKFMDLAARQEAELRQAQAKLQAEAEERRRLEVEHKRELEENELALERHYGSMSEELHDKTSKLKKCWKKLKQIKLELRDVQERMALASSDHATEKRGWEAAMAAKEAENAQLRRSLGLCQLIVTSFVPRHHAASIMERSRFDKSSGKWSLASLEAAGNGGRDGKIERSLRRKLEVGKAGQVVLNLQPDVPQVRLKGYESMVGSHSSEHKAVEDVMSAHAELAEVEVEAPSHLPTVASSAVRNRWMGGHSRRRVSCASSHSSTSSASK